MEGRAQPIPPCSCILFPRFSHPTTFPSFSILPHPAAQTTNPRPPTPPSQITAPEPCLPTHRAPAFRSAARACPARIRGLPWRRRPAARPARPRRGRCYNSTSRSCRRQASTTTSARPRTPTRRWSRPSSSGTASPFQAQVRRPMAYAGYGAGRLQAAPMAGALNEPITLYISNLDYAVSNDDIKELFSNVSDIKRFSINYDRSGRSKGTADVVFSRRSDALAAVKRYNNVQLDGKPMKIEIIGSNIEAPPTPIFAILDEITTAEHCFPKLLCFFPAITVLLN